RRRHTRSKRDWSSDVCSSDLHLVEHGFTPAGVREGSELAELVKDGTLPAATMGLYGSTFFTMTGFHGFHVTCGVISMAYLYFVRSEERRVGKECRCWGWGVA